MNWKKEGYQKDQKVFIVGKGMFTRDINYAEGTVIHAGTKILKVKLDNSERILEFKNSAYSNGAMWGYGYYLYKSKEEYEERTKAIEYKEKLRYEAKESIKYLTNEQLEQIIKWKEKVEGNG